MQDLTTRITALSRPSLLLRAAKFGLDKYSRNRDLRRILGVPQCPSMATGLARLLDLEHEVNHQRQCASPAYSHARHVELLIAFMSEAQAYLAAQHAKTGGPLSGKPPAKSTQLDRDVALT
ncbi:DUF6477 family protein [Epibacterium ulvae]|uniref:DUF6477 family protein n=1 Tax=Epibacterium ulvae TaxID=1156985 RepID=UPI00203FC837|nr:DUF6477 family protein [Epibacterium ulvae]